MDHGTDEPVKAAVLELFQLLDYMPLIAADRTKTDTFRDRFNYSKKHKARLAVASHQGAQAMKDTIADPVPDPRALRAARTYPGPRTSSSRWSKGVPR